MVKVNLSYSELRAIQAALEYYTYHGHTAWNAEGVRGKIARLTRREEFNARARSKAANPKQID